MIPGFIISLITFPGVIVHELAHALFCRLFGLKIYEVRYFVFPPVSRASGYVIHEPAAAPWKNVLISVGPFFLNTIVGSLIAAPGVVGVMQFDGRDPLDLFLSWLGVSIAMHAFPSTGDAASIWHTVSGKGASALTKIVSYPIVGLIYLGALGSMFWLDLLYGVAVAGLIPNAIVGFLVDRAH